MGNTTAKKSTQKQDGNNNNNRIGSNLSNNDMCTNCNINNCSSLTRLVAIDKMYHTFINPKSDDKQRMITFSQWLNTQRMSHILSDYHHVKDKGYCLQSLNKFCPFNNCTSHNRYARGRREGRNKSQQLNTTLLVKQQTLNQIHSQLFHPISFDTNTQQLQQRFVTPITNKFVTTLAPTDDEQKYPTQDKISNVYSFGQEFFYWDYYYDRAWFIKPKYQNFKEELLNNSIFRISAFTWQHQNTKANYYLRESAYVKRFCSNGLFQKEYGIQANIPITTEHLSSILFYCNLTELSYEFSKTYRRLSWNETDSQLKQRHHNFYHFAKLLRETVEVFGSVLSNRDKSLYHGIGGHLFFKKLIARFYGPTSTTWELQVAHTFTGTFVCLVINNSVQVCFLSLGDSLRT